MAVTLNVTLKENSHSVANNTSSVTAKATVTSTYGSWNHYGCAGTATFSGSYSATQKFTATFDKNVTTTIFTKTFTVKHASDGSGSVTFKVTFDTDLESGVLTKSTTLKLTTIPRASVPTVSGTKQLGSTMTINTNRKSSRFTHTLTWSWAGKSGTIGTDVGASKTWNPSIATFGPYLPNGTSSTCKITCTTYNGSTNVGSKSVSFSLAVPSSVVPTVSSVTASDTSGYLDTYGAYVQNKSSIQLDVSAAGANGSTLKEYTGTVGSQNKTSTSEPINFGVPTNSGSLSIKATVKDSRGRTSTAKTGTNITVATYNPPDISSSTASRWDLTSGTEDDEGSTIRVHVVGNVHNVNNKNLNQGTIKVEYKLKTESAWNVVNTRTPGDSWDYVQYITDVPETNAYDVRITCTDDLDTVVEKMFSIDTAHPVLDFRSNGMGVAVLGISNKDGFRVCSDLILENGRQLVLEDSSLTSVPFLSMTDSGRGKLLNHLALSNNISITGMNTSGGETALLRVNPSNQVELNWTIGGLKGRVSKLLWSGTASTNAKLTVSDFPYYNLFAIRLTKPDSTFPHSFLGFRDHNGTAVNFSGNVGEASGTYWEFTCEIAFGSSTSTTGTVKVAKFRRSSGAYDNNLSGNAEILGIWGII